MPRRWATLQALNRWSARPLWITTSRPACPSGRRACGSIFQFLGGIFSDMKIEFDFLLAEGDKVDCHFALVAKHTGEFAGIQPKGNIIRCPAISTFRVEDGKLAEAWEIFDSGNLLQQMRA